MISKPIIELLQATFCLNWDGIHGASHWSRVRINGMMIAKDNGANQKVVELFAFFHDQKERQAPSFASWYLLLAGRGRIAHGLQAIIT